MFYSFLLSHSQQYPATIYGARDWTWSAAARQASYLLNSLYSPSAHIFDGYYSKGHEIKWLQLQSFIWEVHTPFQYLRQKYKCIDTFNKFPRNLYSCYWRFTRCMWSTTELCPCFLLWMFYFLFNESWKNNYYISLEEFDYFLKVRMWNFGNY